MTTYAIVKTGGKQYKVAVGDLVKVEKIEGEAGTSVSLSPILVVDGSTVTSDAAKLAKVSVKAEVVNYVLRKPSAEHREAIDKSIEQSLAALDLLLAGEMERAMMKIHAKPPRPKPPRPEPTP